MHALRFLKSVVLLGALVAPWLSSNAQVKWDLASANPPTNFQTVNLDRFIEDVEKRTNGALKITHHPNSSLFKMAEIRRATQRGQVAIGEVLLGTMVNEFPLLAFDAVPFLFNSREEGQRFWAEIRPQVEKRLAEQGLTILYVQPWQPQGLFSTKPVAGVADLKGTRFRAHSPVFAKYAQAVGAQPLSIPYTELGQAIMTGGVDTMMTGITAAADLKFWKTMPMLRSATPISAMRCSRIPRPRRYPSASSDKGIRARDASSQAFTVAPPPRRGRGCGRRPDSGHPTRP